MTSPLKRIESHPHEAKRLIGIEYDQSFSCSIWTKHIQNKPKVEKHKIRIIKVVDVLLKFYPRKAFVFV